MGVLIKILDAILLVILTKPWIYWLTGGGLILWLLIMMLPRDQRFYIDKDGKIKRKGA
jgi:hypothetical protein